MDVSSSLLATHLGILPQAPEERILRMIVEMGQQIVGADEGSMLVMLEETRELQFVMTTGSAESEKALMGQRVPLDKGIVGLAARTQEVQIGAPTFTDIKQTESRAADGTPAAVLAAPMLIGDTLIGVITAVSFKKDKRFNSSDARLYAGFSTIASLVVDQKRRLVSLEQKEQEPGVHHPQALGETGRLEKTILESVARIVRKTPDSLSEVAKILSAIEAMLPGEE